MGANNSSVSDVEEAVDGSDDVAQRTTATKPKVPPPTAEETAMTLNEAIKTLRKAERRHRLDESPSTLSSIPHAYKSGMGQEDVCGQGQFGRVVPSGLSDCKAVKIINLKYNSEAVGMDISGAVHEIIMGRLLQRKGAEFAIRYSAWGFQEVAGLPAAVIQMEEFPGSLYSYMDFLELRHLKFDTTSAAKVVDKVLRFIASCDKAGVLHGDLKPSNILVDVMPRGLFLFDAFVSDLASCKVLNRSRGKAKLSMFTEEYMAPEMAPKRKGGPHRAVDSRADTYAAAKLLLELLDMSDQNLLLNVFRGVLERCMASPVAERLWPTQLLEVWRELQEILARRRSNMLLSKQELLEKMVKRADELSAADKRSAKWWKKSVAWHWEVVQECANKELDAAKKELEMEKELLGLEPQLAPEAHGTCERAAEERPGCATAAEERPACEAAPGRNSQDKLGVSATSQGSAAIEGASTGQAGALEVGGTDQAEIGEAVQEEGMRPHEHASDAGASSAPIPSCSHSCDSSSDRASPLSCASPSAAAASHDGCLGARSWGSRCSSPTAAPCGSPTAAPCGSPTDSCGGGSFAGGAAKPSPSFMADGCSQAGVAAFQLADLVSSTTSAHPPAAVARRSARSFFLTLPGRWLGACYGRL